MTVRLTALADTSIEQADMKINMVKTYSQHVFKRQEVSMTEKEARFVGGEYKHVCGFYPRRFKTNLGMHIYRSVCVYNYDTSTKMFELDNIIGVFDNKKSHWFPVKWEGYAQPESECEHLLSRDGIHETIRDFWTTSDLLPCK